MNKEEIENYISMVNGRIEKLQSQLDKSNNKIERIKEYVKEMEKDNLGDGLLILGKDLKDILLIIDEENK